MLPSNCEIRKKYLQILEEIQGDESFIEFMEMLNTNNFSLKINHIISYQTLGKTLSEDEIRTIIKNHPIIPLSASVQKFYNGPCCAIDIPDSEHLDEIVTAFKILINKNSN